MSGGTAIRGEPTTAVVWRPSHRRAFEDIEDVDCFVLLVALFPGCFDDETVCFQFLDCIVRRLSADVEARLDLVRGEVRKVEQTPGEFVARFRVRIARLVVPAKLDEFERPLVGVSRLGFDSVEEEQNPVTSSSPLR